MSSNNAKTVLSLLALTFVIAVVIIGILNLNESSNYSFDKAFASPNLEHPFGTDNYGRDMTLMTISGLSISILAGVISSVFSVIIALVFAIFSSSKCKFLSSLFDLMTNAVLGIPHIVLMILISFACGKGAFGVIVAVSLTHWPTLARILSSEIKQIKTTAWFCIEERMAQNKLQFVIKHLLPNVSKQLIVGLTLALPHAILHESTLTFLGFGFSPETPAIGNILSETLKFALTGNWWLSIAPGVCLILIVITSSKLTKRLEYRLENTL